MFRPSLTVVFLFVWFSTIARADSNRLTDQDELFANLVAPMRSVVDGKSFRDALNTIAKQAQVNLWLDRRVDPTSPVALGAVGPTPFAAIKQLADSRECVVMPVANVLLVGRESWVDQTAAAILSVETDPDQTGVNIGWENLTTPDQALAAVADAPVELSPALPHDLWPATTLRAINRRVAIAMILSQFDLQADTSDSLTALRTEPIQPGGSCVCQYALGKSNIDLRREFQRHDSRGQATSKGPTFILKGRIAAHRKAIAYVMGSIRLKPTDIDASTFTIKRMRTSAKNAFEQLAKMAGRSCQIDEDAAESCNRVVSVEGADLTLRHLVDRVATEVGVAATWTPGTIVISVPVGPDR